MRALRKWCKGSVSKSAIAVLGITAIDLPVLIVLFRIYVLIFDVSVNGNLFSWRTMVYLIPALLCGNLMQLETQPTSEGKKALKSKPLLELALIAVVVGVLALIPLDSPRTADVILWIACTLIYFLVFYTIFEIIDKKYFKRLSNGTESER